MSGWRIEQGDCLDVLAGMDPESVHCCITSPPYYGLRDYGVQGQIGLEPTPDEYVAKLVEVFRELRRVLRSDGTLWLNLGDSYAGSWGAQSRGGPPSASSTLEGNGHRGGGPKINSLSRAQIAAHPKSTRTGSIALGSPYKPKDLLGIPWSVAFALRADGWYLRRDVIWSKPNPMPESVTDRPTSAHEYVFLLSKSKNYYYDAEAIREDSQEREPWAARSGKQGVTGMEAQTTSAGRRYTGFNQRYVEAMRNGSAPNGRNKRSVWEIATQPYPEAHFATFPEKLVEPMVLAGTAPKCCGECGAPWRRVVDVSYENPGNRTTNGPRSTDRRHETAGFEQRLERRATTTGWEPTCTHIADDFGACIVLDPFAGSGTTLKVAVERGRDAIGVELNPDYVALAERRMENVTAPLFAA